MRLALRQLIATTLLLVATAAFASKPPVEHYQVELLVYSHLSSEGIGAEYWPSNVNEPHYQKHTVVLEPSSLAELGTYPPLTYLPAEQGSLTDYANKLTDKLPATILYHQTWQVDRKQLRGKYLHFVINNQVPTYFDDSEEEPSYPEEQVSGYLSIRLTNYFNTKLELLVTEPRGNVSSDLRDGANPCDSSGNCYFRFDSTRRTRSKVLNYLDHPMYGALLLVTPID